MTQAILTLHSPAVPKIRTADHGEPALERVFWLLRVACAAEFVGHGAFGIITKAAWLPYFAVGGIPPEVAYLLMPIIGAVDISMGVLTALRPIRPALIYMAMWGLMTALLRPVSGEGVWEFVERIPNFSVPFAMLVLMYVRDRRSMLSRVPGMKEGRERCSLVCASH